MPICNWYVLQELKERVLKGKFSVPFYVPSDLQRLIKKFLVLNPSKRITLEVIKTFLYSVLQNCDASLCMYFDSSPVRRKTDNVKTYYYLTIQLIFGFHW